MGLHPRIIKGESLQLVENWLQDEGILAGAKEVVAREECELDSVMCEIVKQV